MAASSLDDCTIISHPLATTFEHGGYSDKRCRQPECESGICLPVKSTDRRVGNGFVPTFGGKQKNTHTK